MPILRVAERDIMRDTFMSSCPTTPRLRYTLSCVRNWVSVEEADALRHVLPLLSDLALSFHPDFDWTPVRRNPLKLTLVAVLAEIINNPYGASVRNIQNADPKWVQSLTTKVRRIALYGGKMIHSWNEHLRRTWVFLPKTEAANTPFHHCQTISIGCHPNTNGTDDWTLEEALVLHQFVRFRMLSVTHVIIGFSKTTDAPPLIRHLLVDIVLHQWSNTVTLYTFEVPTFSEECVMAIELMATRLRVHTMLKVDRTTDSQRHHALVMSRSWPPVLRFYSVPLEETALKPYLLVACVRNLDLPISVEDVFGDNDVQDREVDDLSPQEYARRMLDGYRVPIPYNRMPVLGTPFRMALHQVCASGPDRCGGDHSSSTSERVCLSPSRSSCPAHQLRGATCIDRYT
jgi:hypothetical protein